MQTVSTIGLDIARSVFQVHGIHTEGTSWLRYRATLSSRRPAPLHFRARKVAVRDC